MKDRIYIILFMMGLAALFGGAVAGIYIGSAETLERNKTVRRLRAYLTVFDIGRDQRLAAREVEDIVTARFDISETVTDPETGQTFTLIKAYDSEAQRSLLGYAFEFEGVGLWGPISGLLAVTPDRTRTLGIDILEHKETPGLGGRIEEPIFTDEFREGVLITDPPEDLRRIIISTDAPDPDTPKAKRHVNAITGATQTCVAMDRILNDQIAAFTRAMENGSKQ